MGKKNFGKGLDILLGSSDEEEVVEKPVNSQEQKRPIGRPKTHTHAITNTSQKGTKEGETRATFILNEKSLERLKALSYWKRKTIKHVLHEALDAYYSTHAPDQIKRAEEEYQKREPFWEPS